MVTRSILISAHFDVRKPTACLCILETPKQHSAARSSRLTVAETLLQGGADGGYYTPSLCVVEIAYKERVAGDERCINNIILCGFYERISRSPVCESHRALAVVLLAWYVFSGILVVAPPLALLHP